MQLIHDAKIRYASAWDSSAAATCPQRWAQCLIYKMCGPWALLIFSRQFLLFSDAFLRMSAKLYSINFDDTE